MDAKTSNGQQETTGKNKKCFIIFITRLGGFPGSGGPRILFVTTDETVANNFRGYTERPDPGWAGGHSFSVADAEICDGVPDDLQENYQILIRNKETKKAGKAVFT
ncbi:MAG: hypothetical protein HYT65_01690 [Candidatus Yanofskybacteria bacterium]|nr:hypothetical protein [Candidatus Yanofskybacteria bacterium]